MWLATSITYRSCSSVVNPSPEALYEKKTERESQSCPSRDANNFTRKLKDILGTPSKQRALISEYFNGPPVRCVPYVYIMGTDTLLNNLPVIWTWEGTQDEFMVCARIVLRYCGHTLVSTWKIGFQNVRQESARTIAQINDASKQMNKSKYQWSNHFILT